jgi:hypothetical protein
VSSRNVSQQLSSILVRLEPVADSMRTPKRVLTCQQLGRTEKPDGIRDRHQRPPGLAA